MTTNHTQIDNDSFESHKKLFMNHGVPININHRDDFLKIMETLTRIGTTSVSEGGESEEPQIKSTLNQLCHILHKRGHYSILHFKELFALDGKPVIMTEDDIAIRNRVAILLEEWDLLSLIEPESYASLIADVTEFKIIKNAEKGDWNLNAFYTIGKK